MHACTPLHDSSVSTVLQLLDCEHRGRSGVAAVDRHTTALCTTKFQGYAGLCVAPTTPLLALALPGTLVLLQ
jgi:hypothetical protein